MTQRNVLITGTSRGIGRGTAVYLANAGWNVLAGVRSEEDGKRIEGVELSGEGSIHSLLLDVADDDSIGRAYDEVARSVGSAGLAGLVNNAGVGGVGPMEHVSRAQLEAVFAKPDEGFDTFSPDNVTPLVSFLASPDAANVSGNVFIVWGRTLTVLQAPGTDVRYETESGWGHESVAGALGKHFEGKAPLERSFIVPGQ